MTSVLPARKSAEFDEALERLDFGQAQEIIRELRSQGHPCIWMQGKLDLERSLIDGTYEDFSSGSEDVTPNISAYDGK